MLIELFEQRSQFTAGRSVRMAERERIRQSLKVFEPIYRWLTARA